jgi:hypothetical protein
LSSPEAGTPRGNILSENLVVPRYFQMFDPGTHTRVPIATTAADLSNFAKIRASDQDFNVQLSDSCNGRVLANLIVF